MAKIKIEDVVDHLRREFTRALEATVKKHFPDAEFDSKELFKDFLKEVYRKCSIWEEIPDKLIDK